VAASRIERRVDLPGVPRHGQIRPNRPYGDYRDLAAITSASPTYSLQVLLPQISPIFCKSIRAPARSPCSTRNTQ
jgi:hypothetical protein